MKAIRSLGGGLIRTPDGPGCRVMDVAIFAFAMWAVGDVPPTYSIPAYNAAKEFRVDENTLGGYLISEHHGDWTDDPTKCSSMGACGPYQLVEMWANEFGGDRNDPVDSARITAQLMLYSKGSHEKCGGPHDWRAHLKGSRKGRDGAVIRNSVKKWMGYSSSLSRVSGHVHVVVNHFENTFLPGIPESFRSTGLTLRALPGVVIR